MKYKIGDKVKLLPIGSIVDDETGDIYQTGVFCDEPYYYINLDKPLRTLKKVGRSEIEIEICQ